MTHYFHLRLDWKTILKIITMGNLKNLQEVAPFIVEIMKKSCWFIEEHHFTAQEMGSRYKLISADLMDKRIELWLPMPEEMYRRLKQLHQDLNYFSIAQLVRLVIAFFLDLRETRSLKDVFALLQTRAKKWSEKREEFRLEKKAGTSPMRKHTPLGAGKFSSFLVIYSHHARPVKKFTY